MRIWGAPDYSSVILIWLLLGERGQSWNPQKKNILFNVLSQHWARRPISLSCMETAWCVLSTEWIMAPHTALWMPWSHRRLHQPRISPSVFWWLGNLWVKSYWDWRGEENGCWKPLNFAGFLWYSYTFARMYSKHLVLLLVICTVVC